MTNCPAPKRRSSGCQASSPPQRSLCYSGLAAGRLSRGPNTLCTPPCPLKLYELVLFSLKNARRSWRSDFLRWLRMSVSVLSPCSSWSRTRLPLSCLTSSSWVLCTGVALSPHDANHSARQASCRPLRATGFGCRSVDLSPWPAPTRYNDFATCHSRTTFPHEAALLHASVRISLHGAAALTIQRGCYLTCHSSLNSHGVAKLFERCTSAEGKIWTSRSPRHSCINFLPAEFSVRQDGTSYVTPAEGQGMMIEHRLGPVSSKRVCVVHFVAVLFHAHRTTSSRQHQRAPRFIRY